MTVKELKNILDACNDDALVCVQTRENPFQEALHDYQVFQSEDGLAIIFITYAEPDDSDTGIGEAK